MKARKFAIGVLVILFIVLITYISVLVFRSTWIKPGHVGVKVTPNDEIVGPVNGLVVYGEGTVVYTYPTSVQELNQEIVLYTNDAVSIKTNVNFGYRIDGDNIVKFFEQHISRFEPVEGHLPKIIPQSKEEIESSLSFYVQYACCRTAIDYNYKSYVESDHDNEVKSELIGMIGNDGIIVDHVKITIDSTSLQPFYSLRDAEEALKAAEAYQQLEKERMNRARKASE